MARTSRRLVEPMAQQMRLLPLHPPCRFRVLQTKRAMSWKMQSTMSS